MCGIFSLHLPGAADAPANARSYASALLELCQSRGKDATGISLHDPASGRTRVYKEPLAAKDFVRLKAYGGLFDGPFAGGVSIVGHNRLATNGSNAYNANNQPIHARGIACVQNGIVTNFDEFPHGYQPDHALDTRLLLDQFGQFLSEDGDVVGAAEKLLDTVVGENTVAFQLSDASRLVHATNVGNLYYFESEVPALFAAASEKYIVQRFQEKFGLSGEIRQLRPGHVLIVDYGDAGRGKVSLRAFGERAAAVVRGQGDVSRTIDAEDEFLESLERLRRCAKCILPETFPYIEFDAQGVCSYCRSYVPSPAIRPGALAEKVSPFRSVDGSPDCLMAFSGGRDSSYALHVLKKEMGMNPVAYSYDWGMVTDLARRNQARLCGALGVEHVWVSADIRWKRENIRKNVQAWIRKPEIGMVPLFMVGDKTYFYHANRVMKNLGLRLIVFAPNNLERTNFKASYCGIEPGDFGAQVHQLSFLGKAKLLKFYAGQYLANPAYVNGSIVDVAAGFLSYYVMKQDFLYFYDYAGWNENAIDETLRSEYGWEWDPSYPSSWRIGDGTAPLYNFIYYYHAGFTENDCFRSNQVREGHISRDEALARCRKENQPRFREIEEYCNMVQVRLVDLVNAVRKIRYRPAALRA